MGFLLAKFLAVMTAESFPAPAPAPRWLEVRPDPDIPIPAKHPWEVPDGRWGRFIFYAKLAEGRVLSCFVRKGMTMEQVGRILGPSDGWYGDFFTYMPLGVSVHCQRLIVIRSNVAEPSRVSEVRWRFSWLSPSHDANRPNGRGERPVTP